MKSIHIFAVLPLLNLASIAAFAQTETSKQAGNSRAAPSVTAQIRTSPEARSTAALALSDEPIFDVSSARRLNDAITRYKNVANTNRWPLVSKDAKFVVGAEGPHDTSLRDRLIASADLDRSEVTIGYDGKLQAAVKRFQSRHGIPPTGFVGPRTLKALNIPIEVRIQQMEASVRRIASIGFQFGPRYVAVNIPAAYAEAVENDKVVRRYRVVVGKSEKPSPTVTSEITNVNLNPTWTVPSSITKNEIAAHMDKDPSYLSRMHMQVFDIRNKSVDPASVDWVSKDKLNVTVRQDAGEWNALGRVRIDMPNSYAVYMHDTNQKTLFDKDYRFDSHGCVRVDNVRDLAEWLLSDDPSWNRIAIDAAIATGERKDIRLHAKIPVAWVYLTSWITRDQIVQFRDDVYDQDAQLAELTADEKAFFDQAEEKSGSRSN